MKKLLFTSVLMFGLGLQVTLYSAVQPEPVLTAVKAAEEIVARIPEEKMKFDQFLVLLAAFTENLPDAELAYIAKVFNDFGEVTYENTQTEQDYIKNNLVSAVKQSFEQAIEVDKTKSIVANLRDVLQAYRYEGAITDEAVQVARCPLEVKDPA